jgi:hypothetical protein
VLGGPGVLSAEGDIAETRLKTRQIAEYLSWWTILD